MATQTYEAWEEEVRLGWLRTLVRRASGLVLVAAAVYVGLALWGFDSSDPSLNHVTNAPVRNPAGTFGAVVADLLFQMFGHASWLMVVAGLATGLRRLSNRPLDWPWLPTLALPGALLALAAWLAGWSLPPDNAWPFRVGLGGFVGDFEFQHLRPELGPILYLWVTGIAACLLTLLSLGVRVDEALWAMRRTIRLSARTGSQLGTAATSAGRVSGRVIGSGIARMRARDADADEEVAEEGRGFMRRGLVGIGARVDPDPDDVEGEAPVPSRRPLRPRSPPVPVDPKDESEERDAASQPAAPARATRAAQPRGRPADPSWNPPKSTPIDPSENFQRPTLDFLMPPKHNDSSGMSKAVLNETAHQLEAVLDDFGVRGQIIDVKPGPVVTLYELEPAPGTRSQRVISLADDIARSLCALSVRVATVPGKNVIGIELPNDRRETVFLRDIYESDAWQRSEARLALALGKDISGSPVIVDLARMPHLLIAGTTGSGKSVAINAMILSLLYRLTPEECRIIMIDPKVIELSIYEDIPHLLAPVVTEPQKAVVALKWVVRAMDERYRLMSHLGVRDIFAFNRRIAQAKARGEELTRRVRTGFEPGTGAPIYEEQPIPMEPLPLIVVIVDEVADLMLTAGKEIENAIQRLSQKARAAGVHLIVATQRPSVDVITGVIKANLPSRISFRVSSKIDSRTVLGDAGAEQLLGQGDMLYLMPGDRIVRVHGPLVTDAEVEAVVRHLKAQGVPDYHDEITSDAGAVEGGGEGSAVADSGLFGDAGSGDALYHQAVQIVARDGKASTSYLQRKLSIGYNSAAKLMERMEREGLISTADHVGRRRVLMGRGGVDGTEPTDEV